MAVTKLPQTDKNWYLLNAGGTALSGAQTVTVGGISSKSLFIVVQGFSSASSASTFFMRFNGVSTGTRYSSVGQYWRADLTYPSFLNGKSWAADDGLALTYHNAATDTSDAAVHIMDTDSSGLKPFISITRHNNFSGVQGMYSPLQGFFNNTEPISSVSVFSSAGNLDAGTLFVYGAK